MPRLIELNHIIEPGMITYKGLPGPVICDYLSRHASRALYAEGTEKHTRHKVGILERAGLKSLGKWARRTFLPLE